MGYFPAPVLSAASGAFDLSSVKRVGLAGTKSVYYTTPINGNAYSTFGWAADILSVAPLLVPKRIEIDRIGLRVTTTGTATLSRLGLYADNGNVYPSSLVLDAGTVPVDTTGFKTTDIAQVLNPGLYWLATVHNGGLTLNVGTPANQINVLGHDPTTNAQGFARIDAPFPFAPLPDPFPANGNYLVGGFRLVFVRVSG